MSVTEGRAGFRRHGRIFGSSLGMRVNPSTWSDGRFSGDEFNFPSPANPHLEVGGVNVSSGEPDQGCRCAALQEPAAERGTLLLDLDLRRLKEALIGGLEMGVRVQAAITQSPAGTADSAGRGGKQRGATAGKWSVSCVDRTVSRS